MAIFNPRAILSGDAPGSWGPSVPIAYDQRDVLLYAVGIGIGAGEEHLRFSFEGHPQFAVFPTFAIRWGSAFSEFETEVHDAAGTLCVRITTGVFLRGVAGLGDIEAFEGAGTSRSQRIDVPQRPADVVASAAIPAQQAAVYRLSGDYNPLHIDPAAARFGGFPAPILHGLCTYGHCAQLLLGALCDGDPARFGTLKARFSAPVYPGDTLQVHAWHDGPGRVVVNALVQGGLGGDRTVVNNAFFSYR